MDNNNCKCPHHKFKGILIFLAALSFLLGHLEAIPMHIAHIIWPSMIMLLGLTKAFGRGMCKCCSNP